MPTAKDAVHSISSCTKMFGLRRTSPSIFWLTLCCWLLGIGETLGKSISGESYSRSTHFQRGDFPGGNQRDIGAMGTGHQNGMVSHTAHPHQRLNRCYSCMSPMYEHLFKDSDLGSFFYEPRNFTAQCEEPMDTRGIGLVPCRGICLSLAQEFVIMGRKTGKRLWMRGCAHSLSRHGYQNRTIAFFAEFDLCREVHPSELFRLADHSAESGAGSGFMSGHSSDAQQAILACSCLGDRCNSHQSSSAPGSRSLLLIALLIGQVLSSLQLFPLLPQSNLIFS